MSTREALVFLIDVDNTLLDNDRVEEDLRHYLTVEFGAAGCDHYWEIFKALFAEQGYADYLGAIQRFRLGDPADPRMLKLASFILDYPLAERLYPGALDALRHLRQSGPTVILSDGDAVLQPRKIRRSGLWDAVEGRVLIYIHKEEMLEDMERRFPAHRYVLIDDKLRILTAAKKVLGPRLTTVFPQQGHFAFDPKIIAENPPPDVTVAHIGELVHQKFPAL